jgi:NAD(P)-dependent dehydrogenase (short-subunit alcohol dehydrogenase family)
VVLAGVRRRCLAARMSSPLRAARMRRPPLQIREAGGRAEAVALDVTDTASVRRSWTV